MKLDTGDLASNAKENMSVFSLHFHKVLNNHRPVDDSVLDLIDQKLCHTTIDTPSPSEKSNVPSTNSKREKHLASMASPQKPSKQWTMCPDKQYTNMSLTSLKGKLIMKHGGKVNASQYQKRAILATQTNGVELC